MSVQLQQFPEASTATLRTLVVSDNGAEFVCRHRSAPAAGSVTIRVSTIGLCRTDLAILERRIPLRGKSLIPGHEFAGVVSQLGAGVDGFSVGQSVTVNPIIACRVCTECSAQRPHKCTNSRMMGVDVDGACIEELVVAADQVYATSDSLQPAEAAFAEPVAAVLAVADVDFPDNANGLIIGDNRIAVLTLRVLQATRGICPAIVSLQDAQHLPANSMDYVIETQLTTEIFDLAARLIRPRGTIIVKSRRQTPVSIHSQRLLPKEPSIRFAHYGRFDTAVRLLVERQVRVNDLIGRSFPIESFALAAEWARQSELQKTFLTIEGP